MRLSIAFPVDLDELEGFVLAARHLGATAVEIEGAGGDAELVVSAPPVEADPPAPVAPAPVRTASLARAKSTRAPGEVKPDTCSHAILTAVADAGGTFHGTLADLGRAHGTGSDGSNAQMATKLRSDGYLTTTLRTGPTTLTVRGWAAIGRTAPASAPRATAAPPKPPERPAPGPEGL